MPNAAAVSFFKPVKIASTTNEERFVDRYKKEIGLANLLANGTGSAANALTFITANVLPDSSLQRGLELVSNVITRLAKGIQGTIGVIDCTGKKNLIPLLGNALEIIISIFVKDDNNRWRLRGAAQGTVHALKIFEQKPKIDDGKGNPLPNKDGKIEFVGGDFSKVGFWQGLKDVGKGTKHLVKELCKDPFGRLKQFSHSTFVFSVLMIIGSISTLLGLDKTSAVFRDTGGAAVDITFLLEKDLKDSNKNKANGNGNQLTQRSLALGKSTLFWAGIAWIWASIFDFFKSIPYINDKVNNLTHASLASDLGASILFTKSNLEATNKAS